MRLRVYISGPMTGLPNLNFDAFNAAARMLRAAGHDVVNPADNGGGGGLSYADYLRRDIRDLLDCDALCLLPGWENSVGARVEKHIAEALSYQLVDLALVADALGYPLTPPATQPAEEVVNR